MEKLSASDRGFMANAYSENAMTVIGLSKRFGVSRQAVYKRLWESGIDTRKRQLDTVCDWCEKPFMRTKARLRRQTRNFCCKECYMDHLRELGKDYVPNRHGQRIGRSTVGKFFTLQDGNVVHHEDGNNLNNLPMNLKVFKNQGDHTRYHRRVGNITPLWDGKKAYQTAGRVLMEKYTELPT